MYLCLIDDFMNKFFFGIQTLESIVRSRVFYEIDKPLQSKSKQMHAKL